MEERLGCRKKEFCCHGSLCLVAASHKAGALNTGFLMTENTVDENRQLFSPSAVINGC